MISGKSEGVEIHRIPEFGEYDQELFDRLYKICRPLIRNLCRNVDSGRFNVSPDVIESYFWDKFLYVYDKYSKKGYDENRLRAVLLSSLKTFKNKLLRGAYTKQAEFNQVLTSLEDLYDSSKELIEEDDLTLWKGKLKRKLHEYLEDNLTPDEILIFQIDLDPPHWFKEKMEKSQGKLTILHLIDFFGLPRNSRSQRVMTTMRNNVKIALKRASQELK